ncbi:hypothetical protein [Paraburkholderia caballeronis]|uniref:Uncharacterized protein n=1 Tax=Paraburkholderia caballeronis TaxID=416943 RepID=A0A1H7I7J6_9BURK|nr:hypothetical protein [Paraburkholderia caballeronis]PXW29184.1 hypothetical protein C7403_10135 [Paraburkholderia caballeronis]PXX04443.1 hypothetical protein C7407_10135 [Paraburkholderia caballeronis]RAK05504.1 hypothetical protein C7409_10135 [Paraburkholderia caballeronis]TDV18280.1 hypothetical protein C7408_10335 [Paraburkholderia caballeronis]TDV20182.1 hypothetical protein C7406_103406 [Paraburkholderia caballeronis]
MIQMMTMTLQAAGLAGNTAAASGAPLARMGGVLRRAVGFAIAGSGLAVIAVHGLQRALGG